jgi:hypothetical protein
MGKKNHGVRCHGKKMGKDDFLQKMMIFCGLRNDENQHPVAPYWQSHVEDTIQAWQAKPRWGPLIATFNFFLLNYWILWRVYGQVTLW